ncbi:MAG: hypothetical protein Tsb0010_17670 [Parvularculaceae bacterium]
MRARALPAVLAAAACAALSACGFQPLYADRGAASAPAELRAVRIAPIRQPEPVGFFVQDALEQRLASAVGGEAPKYELTMRLREGRRALAIQIDSSVTRFNYTLSADYQLRDLQTNAVLDRGRSTATTSFNVVTSQYATLVGERDAQEKAAAEISAEIESRLAVYFASAEPRSGGSAPAAAAPGAGRLIPVRPPDEGER